MNSTLFGYIANAILANENIRPVVYIEDETMIEPIKKLFPKLQIMIFNIIIKFIKEYY